MKERIMSALRFALTLLLTATCLPAPALAASQADYQALKLWCIERDKWSAGGRKWDFPNRDEYTHFHHYCSAVNALNKAIVATSKKDLTFQLGEVMNNTGYVISHVAPDHPLLAEVYALRGKAGIVGHNNVGAEMELLQALRRDPKHVDAIATLAQLYADTGRKDKAVETVRTGLASAPGYRSLRRLGKELGLQLPPVEEKPSEAAARPPQTPIMKKAEPASPPVHSAGVKQGDPVKPPQPGVDIPAAETKVGSPKNPWCRFCPDTPAAPPELSPSTPGVIPKAVQ